MVLIVTVPCNCSQSYFGLFYFRQLTLLADLRRNITVRLLTMESLLVAKFVFIITYYIFCKILFNHVTLT